MAEIAYLDFDLLIERTTAGYRARVLRSPVGETTGEFQAPLSNLELENFLLRMGRPRRRVRRLESAETQATKTVGGQLFNAIFAGTVGSCFHDSLQAARGQGLGLRIRLRLTDAPELVDLPWEYLYQPALNRFLALSKETPVVRFLETPERPRALAVTPPLKVLVMIASPSDHEPLDVGAEWARLRSALTDLEQRGLVTLEALEDASLPALQRRLRRGEYHIFHFIGHGGFDEAAQDGVLLLEDPTGRGRPVSGQNLGTLLNDHRSLRLAILNACEGARSSRSDPFAGTAQSLLQQGLPAVIAMQFEITDDAAVTFAHEFYAAIADGYPADAALAEARRAIFAAGNELEWGTPVLYMRSADGKIFDLADRSGPSPEPTPVAPVTNTPQTAAHLAELYDQALGCYYTDQWAAAVGLLQEVLALQPAYEDARTKLAAAVQQQTLLDHYTAGQQASQTGAWDEAIKRLEAAVALDPGYRDAAARLTEARRQHELADLYAEAHRVFKTGNWQAVINVCGRIAALDPSYPDPDRLLATARERLIEEERNQQASAAYREGLRHLDARRWAEAVTAFEQVEATAPGYQQTAALLARARNSLAEQQAAAEREVRAETLYRQANQALQAGQLTEAIGRLEALEKEMPGYRDGATRLVDARRSLAEQQAAAERKVRAEALYRRAVTALKADQAAIAIDHLEALQEELSGYRDAETLLAQARQTLAERAAAERRLAQAADLYRRADDALAARDWSTAVALLAQTQGIEPGYRDVTRKLADARQQQALAAQFSGAMAHMQASRWADAVQVLRELVAHTPNYADPVHGRAVDLLMQALQQKEHSELPPPPARRARPAPTEEEPKPVGKPKGIPR